ncbi:MAG: putative methyl-accepting chemotaxis protein [Gammaproteobacteria bacterium]|nr:MAG: putative methyl-accepting chemotaxis protein [Gammaproteobacteria bacterium]
MTQQTQTHSEKSTVTRTVAKEAPGSKTAGTGRRAAGRKAARATTPEERHGLIAEAAYLIAEQRGFQGEAALDDWLQAEAEIDMRLFGSP